jgi:hypothetical protein
MQSPKKTSKNAKQKEAHSPIGPKWSENELQQFFNGRVSTSLSSSNFQTGFKVHGTNWKAYVGEKNSLSNRTYEMAENLFLKHKTFLTTKESTADMFVSIVTDMYNNYGYLPVGSGKTFHFSLELIIYLVVQGAAKTPKSAQKTTKVYHSLLILKAHSFF